MIETNAIFKLCNDISKFMDNAVPHMIISLITTTKPILALAQRQSKNPAKRLVQKLNKNGICHTVLLALKRFCVKDQTILIR